MLSQLTHAPNNQLETSLSSGLIVLTYAKRTRHRKENRRHRETAQYVETGAERDQKREEDRAYKKGDRVNILNPNRGQGSTGIIQKVNLHTERVTVEAYNLRGVKELVIRKITNVERIEK